SVHFAGYGPGRAGPDRLGLTGAGPRKVITDLGVLEPDPATRELTLTGVCPGVSPEEAKAGTGWDLAISGSVEVLDPPSPPALSALPPPPPLTPRPARAH